MDARSPAGSTSEVSARGREFELLAEPALDLARASGATYADVRFVEETKLDLAVRLGQVADCSRDESLGVGIRVLVDGAWGYASAPTVDPDRILEFARIALREAKSGSKYRSSPAVLAPVGAVRGAWTSPREEDPFDKELDVLFGELLAVDAELRKAPEIASTSCVMSFARERQWQFTSEGSALEQDQLRSGAGFSITVAKEGVVQTRSYPASFGGQYLQGGYEIVRDLALLDHAARTREEARSLLEAEPCPDGVFDLVIGGSQLALQIHESVGHPNEFDRVLGFEADLAGRSFVTPEKRNEFVYGAGIVNFVADSKLPGGLATFGWDDDAVPAQRWNIVENGVHRNWFTNREFATRLGDASSLGSNRAQGWRYPPQIRIPNLSLMWGDASSAELIAGVDDGFLLDGVKTWSIDQMRLNFQFTCEIGWRIRNGKLAETVRNPTYQGVTPQFWRACDGIAGRDEWVPWGVPNCGKGQPMQVAEMSHGCAPARFRGIQFVRA